MTLPPQDLLERAQAHGQDHVFRFWNELSDSSKARLLGQLEAVDFELVKKLGGLLQGAGSAQAPSSFEPPELFPLERSGALEERAREARAVGEGLLSEGTVGFLLVAGGQASRLGYDGPKGAFPVGPVTGRTLFELHARRIRAARERYGAALPWYVMTSPANDAVTREFFDQNDYFGLPREDVSFFEQEMLPALDLEGRILLSERDSLFLAPNGHGGVLAALASSGHLADAQRRGIRHLSYFQVDNPLVRPADPLFLGLHALESARMSSKVVAKRDAGEKVGVIGRANGALGCIEYSDLPSDLREARGADGALLFGAGNIAVHVLDVDFVDELTRDGLELEWHVARKTMRVLDEAGAHADVAGAKFEAFVFDALGQSPRSVTLEVARHEEFSPVKNAEGEDSPATARRDQCSLHASWVEAAGLPLPAPDATGVAPVEVDPLLADSLEELRAAAPLEPRALEGGHLYDA
jgi:UDP-N-acetylglucosamine/UDP-N-acetylgalactosamine diphosphorylase